MFPRVMHPASPWLRNFTTRRVALLNLVAFLTLAALLLMPVALPLLALVALLKPSHFCT